MHKYYEIHAQTHNVRCKVYSNDLRSARKIVIFGTGFAGHRDNGAAERFAEKALSKHRDLCVLAFNWPAHGDDVKPKLVLQDCDTYLTLVLQDVETRFGIRELYAYATSFGGYLFLKYISEHGNPFRRLVFRCPAVNMYNVLVQTIMKSDEYDRILKGKDVSVGFDRRILINRALLDDLKRNDIRQRDYLEFAEDILIMHGTGDEVVPFEETRKFAEDNLIEFIPVEGADHRFQSPRHMDLANANALKFFGG